VPFIFMVVAVLVFAVLLADPPRVLLVLFARYALSGPVTWLWRAWRQRRSGASSHSSVSASEDETGD
jgi:CDP-diacylglycerol--serine O-phosphatidyltransferase